jgi:hypothetical protein
MRQSAALNPKIVAEVLDIMADDKWKVLQDSPRDNATVYWMFSPSYGRDVIKLTV